MNLVVLCISILLTIVFPILALPVNLFGMIFSKGKMRKAYGFLLAFSLAILAYIWIPDSTMDLYRHHQQVSLFAGFNVDNLLAYMQTSLEPLHYLTKFFVAQIGDYNLLQFLIILVGYFELFWMICDLVETRKVKRGIFLIVLLYAFSAVRFIDFASGLRFNFAVINIALGIYYLYFKNSKYVQYGFFLVAACMHISTLLMIALVLVLSKLKSFKKVKLAPTLFLVISVLAFSGMVIALNNVFGEDGGGLMSVFNKMYGVYFAVNTFENTSKLYTGFNLIFPMVNMVVCALVSLYIYKKTKYPHYCSLVFFLSLWVLIMTLFSGVFMRYGFMLVIITAPILMELLEYVKDKKMGRLVVILALTVLTGAQLGRSYSQARDVGLVERIDANVTNGVGRLVEE